VRVRVGMLIRSRRSRGEAWDYGRIVRVDESGVIHVDDEHGRRRLLPIVEARRMFDEGNLDTRAAPSSRERPSRWRAVGALANRLFPLHVTASTPKEEPRRP
jgi:hypothetical protein